MARSSVSLSMARNLLLTAVCLFFVVGFISTVILGTRTMEETTKEVINALSHNNFDDWSPAFISTNDPVLGEILPATLFIPLSGKFYGGDPRHVAAYDIVPKHLCFTELLAKEDRTLLPTLLPGFSILISNSSRGLTVDGVEIVEPDVFVDSVMVVHRIPSPLDSRKYGGGTVNDWKLWAISLLAVWIMLSAVAFYVWEEHYRSGIRMLQKVGRSIRLKLLYPKNDM